MFVPGGGHTRRTIVGRINRLESPLCLLILTEHQAEVSKCMCEP
jgi:hypothetical protein